MTLLGELPSNWIYHGRANFITDNLIAEAKVVPMVIAIPHKHTELTFKIFEAEATRPERRGRARLAGVQRREPRGDALQ